MSEPVIRTIDLSRRFRRKCAVDGLNLEVPRGQVFGLLGRNGAGKTTLIKMLLGLLNPSGGRMLVLGLDPTKRGPKIRLHTGYVAENQQLYSWMTVAEAVGFHSSFYPTWQMDEARRLLERFDLPLDSKVKELSRGMLGKLCLALALAHKPELLVLDDPAMGLDAIVRREFLRTIADVIGEGDRSVFLTSHLVDEVERVSDRVAIIHDGKILIEGTLDEVKQSFCRFRAVFRGPLPAEVGFPGERLQPSGPELSLTVRAAAQAVGERLKALGAEHVEQLPLSLEDVFTQWVGVGAELQ